MEQTDATRPHGGAHVLLSIQALRCFAVMGVILFHIQHYYSNKLQLPGFLPRFDVGSAGVDLFFVISGFIMVYAFERLFGQPGGTRIFLARRLARIVPMRSEERRVGKEWRYRWDWRSDVCSSDLSSLASSWSMRSSGCSVSRAGRASSWLVGWRASFRCTGPRPPSFSSTRLCNTSASQ